MKANELQITNFLQAPNVQFVIPVYQRNYDWTNAECQNLLDDVISIEKESRGTHFIGSIVFIHEGTYSTSEVKELVIIDGQQRLTTINILYVALYRFALGQGKEQDADRLYNMFLTNQYVQDESSKLKLKQTDSNSEAFNAILLGNKPDEDVFSNVVENYNYFRRIINEENFDIISKGLNRLIFVEISLERDKDDPQRIFESLNSTGLDLSQSDLIRNFILMDLPPKEQKKVFKSIWNPIEANARDIKLQKSKVSEYIRDYLTLKNKKIPNKSKVYQEFKLQYGGIKDEEYKQDLENIKSLSVHYKKFLNPSTVTDPKVQKELTYVHRLEINVAYPFLLQVFEDAENGLITNDELIKLLQLVQSYVWRRFIVGLPTNALNKIFMTLYSEVDTEEYYDSVAEALIKKKGSAKFPTNEDIKSSLKDRDLYNIQAKNRQYLFEMLENYNNKEYVDTSNEDITIEHIFPQNPKEEWNDEISPDEFFQFKEKYLNTIGNLTLSGNNGALGNKLFQEKKEMNIEDGEQGYIHSRLWLNKYLQTIDHWDIDKYEERFTIIYQRFLKIWEFPDIEIVEADEGEEINIYDSDSPTFKKLDYFIFESNKIEEIAIARMYFYVIAQLYNKNPQSLLNNQDILKISKQETEFRTPQEVVNGWFIEANIDSNTKFTILKKLLPLFDLEDELIIKFQSSEEIEGRRPNAHGVRKKFWTQILPKLTNTALFDKVTPSKDHWLSTGAGTAGLAYTMVISKKFVRIELTISTASKEKNKKYFHKLHQNKSQIENQFGKELEWEELPENKMSRIKIEKQGVSIFNDYDWLEMSDFLISNLREFENALEPFIDRLK
ncbi:MAG: DUF4268 domain-containing protein [Bacteroidota bacterium]